jgi:hypothetical protein
MLLAGADIAVRPGTAWNAAFGSLSYTAQVLGAVALVAVCVAAFADLSKHRGSGGERRGG